MTLFRWLYRLLSFSYRAERWYANKVFPHIGPKQAHVRMLDGTILFLEPCMDYVQREIFLHAGEYSYEKNIVSWMRYNLHHGMVVLDVGAHIGYYSGIISNRIGPKGRAFLIEPFPGHYQLLARAVETNSFKNVEPLNLALSDRDGEIELFSSMDGGRNSLAKDQVSNGDAILVRSLSLDSLFFEYGIDNVDFMQMDIEGAECLVLNSFQSVLRNRLIRCILCEFHPRQMYEDFGRKPRDFLEMMADMRYSVTKLDPKDGHEMQFDSARIGEYQHLLFRIH